MSTPTNCLPCDLKAHIAEATDPADTTPHNFFLQASAEKTALEERHAVFHTEADRRYDDIIATGR